MGKILMFFLVLPFAIVILARMLAWIINKLADLVMRY
jgi:hypothetical protein